MHTAPHLYTLYCSHSLRALFPKTQTCMNALRVFHRLSSYFIHSFWINTNRMDECIDVGTNACLCVTFYWTQPKLFLSNLSYRSRVYTVKSWLFPTRFKMLHAPSLSLPNSLFFSPYISFIPSLPFSPTVRCTHSQAGRKSTHIFSLNTLNLNLLLIRRYVTSLTLPSSPSFTPPILCTHPHPSILYMFPSFPIYIYS